MRKLMPIFCSLLFRSELAERETMLRTKAMREREEMKERRKYRFCLIRVRFPDGLVLQVTQIIFQLFGTENSAQWKNYTKWCNLCGASGGCSLRSQMNQKSRSIFCCCIFPCVSCNRTVLLQAWVDFLPLLCFLKAPLRSFLRFPFFTTGPGEAAAVKPCQN